MKKAKVINEMMLVNFYKEAKSISATAKEFGINRNRVRSILSKLKTNVIDNKGGAPKKIGDFEERRLVKNFKSRELKLASEGVDYLKDSCGVHVSDQTVRNVLNKNGLVVKTPVKKLFKN